MSDGETTEYGTSESEPIGKKPFCRRALIGYKTGSGRDRSHTGNHRGTHHRKVDRKMAKKDNIIAFLGEKTSFEGKLNFEGTLQIDGCYRGDIAASGDLIIGRTGKVESNIHVSTIIVNGEVHGNVVAEKCIEIRVPGKVYGDILAPTVVIHEGVIFEGNCRTQPVKAQEKAKLSVLPTSRGLEKDQSGVTRL